MESPTIEISRGLEALRLAGHEEELQDNLTLPDSDKAMSHQSRSDNEVPHTVHHEIRTTDTEGQALVVENRFESGAMLCNNGVVRGDLQAVCSDRQKEAHQSHSSASLARTSSIDSLDSNHPANCNKSDYAAGIISSFDTLHVSSTYHHTPTSHPVEDPTTPCHPAVGSLQTHEGGLVAIPRNCRQEAAASMYYLDDTTVDDLAGYLDEIMFLPKPMSEMAELMYT